MRILVTNDDGIFAPGVEALVEVLQHFGEVYVVCPDQERSAVGHSITLRTPLKVKPVEIFSGTKGAWAVNGTPADCVKLGMEVLLKTPPDILFSGINLGPNLGRDLYYSGTLAGAVEASLYNVPAVSVSLNEFDEAKVNYLKTKQLLYKAVEIILQNRIPKGVFLNINLPNIPIYLCKGVEVVPLDLTVSRYRYVGLNDPHGQVYFWLKDELNQLVNLNENSDYLKLKEGYITVSPVEFPVHHKRKMEQIERWFRKCSLNFLKEGKEEHSNA
ncbi:MAG: 5'/3'-nucleotidase SurE [Bacillaceae bacterium]|uniref:5'-nucleotidase SurE n=1 Tax=Aeribacillus composti TaxID=1868734 RepID=A0ABY9WC02_9BACI|nr:MULTISPECIES: 5'/3'-nucleotidase SurE [Aeribacillus]AXI38952.1 5'/3'-nucleotidase SurE [Bacillaceae bacterium ZC4]REJ19062.1 MAG: 5'/3'-nucleotidase SurE [Bacillaceae bacterium]KZM56055.1 5'/3'-nucleotidase SurE [Aeribacillus pallidus]MDR9791407.1 5'/3'-nucleotidase SurE [Aeribacillus pallidus]MDR9797270.1 5'/3'-nucleotidase SurE [Aeribacillus pallidus]